MVLVAYRTCPTSNTNRNLWGQNSRVCVREQWESVFILKFRKGNWPWQERNFVDSLGPLLLALFVFATPYKCLNMLKYPPLARCVFADSWFASVNTALALRNELGVHFTGPVKTATANFPIEQMRHTLAKMKRGEHIVFECVNIPNLWAVGWHDHHFKCKILKGQIG